MPNIPNDLNGVSVKFADKVNKEVDSKLLEGMRHCIKSNVAKGFTLKTVYISSANDQHTLPSRHMQKKAVDISRVNGTKMSVGYKSNKETKVIVDAIQAAFETFKGRRENYGPSFKKKKGKNWQVSGHNDHIHISVD